MKSRLIGVALVSAFSLPLCVGAAFEGRINATVTRGGQTETFFYVASTNLLLIERGESDRPYPRNIVNLDTGELTLVFPHNRSYVRLQPAAQNAAAIPPGFPAIPAMPPAAGPQNIGPTNLPGMPAMPQMPNPPPMPPGVGPQAPLAAMPAMPNMPARSGMPLTPPMPMMMPPMMTEKMELKATTDTTNLLGCVCTRYELKQRGEVMEIWATDKLLAFEPYLQNQPHRFGPRMIEEQWGELLRARKLFPLLSVLKFEAFPPPARPSGTNSLSQASAVPRDMPARYRFEIKSIMPEKNTDETLFQPPPDYQEIQPLPF